MHRHSTRNHSRAISAADPPHPWPCHRCCCRMAGLTSAMDTVCGQVYGAGCHASVGVVLQRAVLVCLLLGAPSYLVMWQAEAVLLLLGEAQPHSALSWLPPTPCTAEPLARVHNLHDRVLHCPGAAWSCCAPTTSMQGSPPTRPASRRGTSSAWRPHLRCPPSSCAAGESCSSVLQVGYGFSSSCALTALLRVAGRIFQRRASSCQSASSRSSAPSSRRSSTSSSSPSWAGASTAPRTHTWLWSSSGSSC